MNELERLVKLLKTQHVFLTGGGGVGKSYLCNQLISDYRSRAKQVVVLGSTGISAVHVGGQTIHSFFAFGISPDVDAMMRNDRYNRQRIKEMNKVLSSCDLLIIDEISMVSSELMEMIRYRLVNGKFEGSLLFVGDFFQLPPVVKRSSDGLWKESLFAFESTAWQVFEPTIVTLQTPKRTHDLGFFSVLNRIRRGAVDHEVMSYLERLRTNVHVWEESPTILFGRNAEAEKMNRTRLAELESDLIVMSAQEKLHDKSLHVKRMESWKKALPVPEKMELKVGAHVLFCTNKWGKYYNGEHGIVRFIDDESIGVEKESGMVNVERHEFTLHETVSVNGEVEEKPVASIHQFPLKLAYAITIHKSQGMSIERLVCNVDHIFETSQFYVAVSRAKDPNVLHIHYSYPNFAEHINRCVRVDKRVVDFYEHNPSVTIEDNAGQPQLF